MQRIGSAVMEFEKTTMRKVVGTDREGCKAIGAIPYWVCGFDILDLYCEKRMRELDKQARLDEVVASQTDRIVSGIKKIVFAGRTIFTSPHDKIIRAHYPE